MVKKNKEEKKSQSKKENKSENKEENKLQSKEKNKSENKLEDKSENKLEDKEENKLEDKEENKLENKEENKLENKEENKEEIIKIFKEKIKGKKIEITNYNSKHCGKEGHWLEKGMGIKHNSNNEPDLFGYEMKKEAKKITFGDFSASEYAFSSKNKRNYINKINNWKDEENEITRDNFLRFFGSPNPKKNNRLSWSGKCIPKYNTYNNYGQIMLVDKDNNISIYYSHSKDKIFTDDKFKECKKNFPEYLKKDNILIAYWGKDKMKKHIEDKFNKNGFFICKKINDTYEKICFGKKFDYECFISHFKTGDIFFDSGMYKGNNRNYSQFRATDHFWDKLIIEEF